MQQLANVGDNHLGEFGIQTVDELASAKAVVADIVPPTGQVVLNADNAPLVRMRETLAPVVWFTLDEDDALVHEHVGAGGEAWIATRSGELVRATGATRESFGRADALPLTLGGAARHNVANILGLRASNGSGR